MISFQAPCFSKVAKRIFHAFDLDFGSGHSNILFIATEKTVQHGTEWVWDLLYRNGNNSQHHEAIIVGHHRATKEAHSMAAGGPKAAQNKTIHSAPRRDENSLLSNGESSPGKLHSTIGRRETSRSHAPSHWPNCS